MQGFLPLGLSIFVLVAFWLLRSPFSKGAHGESRVNSTLRRHLDEQEYRLLSDLTLPTPGGTTQVDHVLVSRFGVFVIETKNMKGWIYGSADQAKWTQVIYRHKSQFQNPTRQNYKHVKTIEELLALKPFQIHSVVVFVGSAVPKTTMPDQVVWGVNSLSEYITSKRDTVIGEHELDGLVKGLSESRLQSSIQTNHAHVRQVKALVAKRKNVGNCPRCGAKLVARTNRQTGEEFHGCSRFPTCKGAQKLQ